MTTTRDIHWTSKLLPEMASDHYAALKADIERHGLLEPIVLWHNQIVDGRHRHRACLELRLEPNFEVLPETMDEAAVFDRALSKNVVRRHLSTGQRALIAHDLLHGEASANLQSRMTVAQAAGLLGVSDSAVNMLIAALKRAPQVRDEVLAGKLTINAARELADFAADMPDAADAVIKAVRAAPTPKAAKKVAAKAAAGVREGKRKSPLPRKTAGQAKVAIATGEPDWHGDLLDLLLNITTLLKREPPSSIGRGRLVNAVDEALQVLNAASFTHEEA